MAEVLYWTKMDHPFGVFYLMASDRGLCRITWPHEPFDMITRFHQRHAPHAALIEDPRRLESVVHQLEAYWNGQRNRFDISLDLVGTPFQVSVWTALQTIRYGSVSTYGAVAAEIGRPKATRAVGTAIGQNPVPIVVPCHRVIGKDGTLTGFGGGLRLKACLLRMEGVNGFIETGHSRFRD
ncbi:MAG: methylated-DNA--[protein]-cysteine S-methyltransferase [Firmicutes bacterium]|jgi:O-6-methylguanine DNA methyltransferase|uniref:Methylated-DNA--protein-cysteine methyltransferase n=1 Tax=Sulfobacillus benefaciens TaxID=453960 RepID=A0A2T2WXN5_9FIRM|nr:methylated-DNA--[protein]-cysteine S-methyltransferase [Bacillota bacterium]MCL5013234.1 methylated-DNA--[protein]-cysteine S-methyltransferase [Bacillota bacterium]PSR26999.1 MAG: cysteine methyltransferase [Sulfobacillus benefaciens]HBQ95349.1 cysteine methyltransferase [Sulfobacillus sp.]